jgi:hypothetical protein
VVCSIRGFTSLVKKKILVSQHTALFTERCWFQKLVEMKWKKFWIMLQKLLTLSNTDQFTPECLKNCENLDKLHINLMLHTEIWCLSRARVRSRVFELKAEI